MIYLIKKIVVFCLNGFKLFDDVFLFRIVFGIYLINIKFLIFYICRWVLYKSKF